MIVRSDCALSLDGTPISLPMEQMREFLLANVSEPCILDGTTVGDLMNMGFHIQGFIHDYFLEEYHVVNALVCTLEPIKKIERVEFYKELVIDGDAYLSLVPKVNIVVGEEGASTLKDAPVVLLDELKISDYTENLKSMKLMSHFTLLEVIDCAFSELGHIVTNNPEESVHIWSL